MCCTARGRYDGGSGSAWLTSGACEGGACELAHVEKGLVALAHQLHQGRSEGLEKLRRGDAAAAQNDEAHASINPVERADRSADPIDLGVGQLGEHRQTEKLRDERPGHVESS